MKENVQKLAPVSLAPNTEVIKTLEQALDMAKAGELRDCAVIGTTLANSFWFQHATENRILLAGHILFIQARLLDEDHSDCDGGTR